MQIVKTSQTINRTTQTWKNDGLSVAFVPTMGGLHKAHLALIEKATQVADKVVISIFVNPKQFSPDEDFDRYPRTLEKDLLALENKEIDTLFLPDFGEVFGNWERQHLVGTLGRRLCGVARPHFFQGVSDVVSALFAIVRPDKAIFGEKDYQQLMVIKKMVTALKMPVKILAHPTVREVDKLAVSTRNLYLQPKERIIAPKLFALLLKLKARYKAGKLKIDKLTQEVENELGGEFVLEYVEILDGQNLCEINHQTTEIIILIAAHLGETRLIDNLKFNT